MNKSINIFLSALAVVLFATACEEFLMEEPVDAIPVDYVFTTPDGLEVAVTGLYNMMRTNNFPSGDNDTLLANAFFYVADDLGLTRTRFEPYGNNMNPLAWPHQKWTLPYQIIDRANAIIASAPNIEMEQAKKDHLVAQARLIRGELYFDLICMYDRILLDTVHTTPENVFDPVVYEVADTIAVFELIDADLDFAIAHLNWTEEFGRYNQATARHIRGKSAMWQSKWAEAAEQFDEIINNGTYHLLPNIEEVFGQNLNHPEALFVYPFDQSLGGLDGDHLAGGGGTWMSSFFNNRYFELTGGYMVLDADLGGKSLGWCYPNDYLFSLYDTAVDKRFETYYYPLKLYVNNPDCTIYGQPLPEQEYDDNYRRYHWSLKKYHNQDKELGVDNSYKSIIYYRFAETLFLGAEAHWRLSNNDPRNATALEYINLIRHRAGLPDYEDFTLDNYLDEYARELAFEKTRWFLLKRLGLLFERQSQHYQFGSNSTNVVIQPMQTHMVRLPIPQRQMDLMQGSSFEQNPGY